MSFVVENIRLGELALIAEQNWPFFDDFLGFLKSEGYQSLHAFVTDPKADNGAKTIMQYLLRPLPSGIHLLDGVAREYKPDRAKWLFLGWLFRDAPTQRLAPMVSSMEGSSPLQRQALILNIIRMHVAKIFPKPDRWEWPVICEVFIDRLEGSRRAIKGTLFEAIVRRHLSELFEKEKLELSVRDNEIRLEGETYDVSVTGKKGQILIPVKTRETMGGGHALLFTRDIHKSISAAASAGYDCLPIVIAESWVGDLSALKAKDYIYIPVNPNQVLEIEKLLPAELKKRVSFFRTLTR
jgi:hypothetical protein